MLQIKELCVKYDNIQVLHGISLELQEGELVALIGANGAGKTTTLSTISGVKRAFSGQIVYDGKDITKAGTDEIVKMGIVQVPEGRQIFSKMTIEENLILGAYTEKDSQRQKQNMKRVMELFPILRERRRQTAGTLSGGEQQMLAIARALMGNPRMLLLDEPSMGLSPLLVQEIFDIIQDVHKDGMTILLVEQNAQAALSVADRAYVLETGRISLSGTGAELILIEKCLGREVPHGGLPADAGAIVMNVTSVSALGKYLATGMPVVERTITLDGEEVTDKGIDAMRAKMGMVFQHFNLFPHMTVLRNMTYALVNVRKLPQKEADACAKPQNLIVPVGASYQDVIDAAGLKPDVTLGKVIAGGAMMGPAVESLSYPTTKTTSGLILLSEAAAKPAPAQACIRCGRCIEYCPMGLAPVEVNAAYATRDVEELGKLHVDYCFNCGSCTFVCPAKRPCTQMMSLAKAYYLNEIKKGGNK